MGEEPRRERESLDEIAAEQPPRLLYQPVHPLEPDPLLRLTRLATASASIARL
jgi:hypothetical protein